MSKNIEDYKKFLEEFKIAFDEHKKRCEERRRRGIHDLNIFDVLETKEVKHSKFLSALLDPDGLHYQNDLFLREFVDICELKDFDFDTSRAKVYREYNNIDIYITDGDKHIIIENKIWTSDHDEQIARYIQAIVDEQDEQDEIYERILVLYLTPFDDEIKELGGIAQINENYLLTDENYNSIKVSYKRISYQKEILEWISKIKLEIANLIDLSVIISQYEKLVKNLTNQGEKMENKEIFSLIQENHSICIDIVENFEKASRDIINDFIKNYLYPKIEAQLKGSEWLLEEFKENYEDYDCIVKVKHKEYTEGNFLLFVLQANSHFSMLEWGLINSKNKLNRSESKLTELIENILNSGKCEKIKAIKGAEGEWACAKKIDDFSNNLVLKLIEYKKNNEFEKMSNVLTNIFCENLFNLKDDIIAFNKELKNYNTL
ncbi:PD-(D/E)XK nuclease family protein [Campylobacter sp.]|uniref:PDDEXK-like family protein n=1 Tax=Campylobacter sp. TaxID=205 RepID=UPI002AA6274C|nr:PD-(D/E)XK nuclease family protein [Campylobacter sp.]MCI7582832.1 PD-(D/E)XK nuclease family protein [Campylobacter sp.]